MLEITKAKIKLQELELENYVKEIKQQKDLKMSKKVTLKEKYLPEPIEAVYTPVIELVKLTISTKKINYSVVLNVVWQLIRNYKEIPVELKQDGLKEMLIGRVTTDILDFINPQEAKVTYGIEGIIIILNKLFETINVLLESKSINFSEIVDDLFAIIMTGKQAMLEFNDLDNNEIGEIAEYIADKLIK